jgi:quinol monooxygenase YgiN
MKLLLMIGGLIMGIHAQAAVWKGHAILVVKPERVSAFKVAVNKIIAPTRQEVGCISYEGFQVVDEHGQATNRFEFHEVWASKEAMLIDHKENAPHMQIFFKEIEGFLESFEVGGTHVLTDFSR